MGADVVRIALSASVFEATMSEYDPQIDPSWKAVLQDEFRQGYYESLTGFVVSELQDKKVVYPPPSRIFAAFDLTPFDRVKVVILGQDPYHGPNQAHGLSFSVPDRVTVPPSLMNIYKELHADLGLPIPKHGNLEHWARQGVLLLNAVLTVRHKTPASHAGKGWEKFTDRVIRELSERKQHLVFILWGKYAQEKGKVIDPDKHLIIQSPHPSPYSASYGFFGSKPFSKTNQYLESHGITPIDWRIPDPANPA